VICISYIALEGGGSRFDLLKIGDEHGEDFVVLEGFAPQFLSFMRDETATEVAKKTIPL
jgi:hypothetical protein